MLLHFPSVFWETFRDDYTYNAAAKHPIVYCTLSGWEATCDAPDDPYQHRVRVRPARDEGSAYRRCRALVGLLFDGLTPTPLRLFGAQSFVLGVSASGSAGPVGADAGVIQVGIDRSGKVFMTSNVHGNAGPGIPQASAGITAGFSSGSAADQMGRATEWEVGANGILLGIAGGGDFTWTIPEGRSFADGYWTASGTLGLGLPPAAWSAFFGWGVSGGSASLDLCAAFRE